MNIGQFHKKLHAWYKMHGRTELPWRMTRDPYAIYVSEIMLQQTQVSTVLARYYYPFLEQFPTLCALAAAPREAVLNAWQGLGYYNRAANMHEAAMRAGKALPDSVEGLMALPGIGRNTAHAVAAFAFHLPVPVMEANVKRVLSRIFALKQPSDQQLWDHANLLLDATQPFDYNQAMMDIGATVCTRRNPQCPRCPAQAICLGKGDPEAYPAPKRKKIAPVRSKYIAVLRNPQGEFYATPRHTAFLRGLYHFLEVDAASETITFQGVSYPLKREVLLGAVRQQYSHFTLEANIYLLAVEAYGTDWHTADKLHSLPWSNAELKILALLGE